MHDKPTKGAGLGDLLGPIGLSLGKTEVDQVISTSRFASAILGNRPKTTSHHSY